ncbi:MAG: hypothetical protein R3B48_24365 [Kofleriaceae bacterium]
MLLACGGCRARQPKSESADAGGAPPPSWRITCPAALATLSSRPTHERAAAILRACEACPLRPLLRDRVVAARTAGWVAEIDAAIEACSGYCSPQARQQFLRHLQHQRDTEEPSATPWRELGAACPAELGWTPETQGFLGATWFALEHVARRVGRELPAALGAPVAPFPLPAVAAQGRGVELPEVSAPALATPGRLAITLLASQVMIGRLPWARLTEAGLQVDGDYPGSPAPQLAEAVTAAAAKLTAAALQPEPASDDAPVTVLTPRGLPAARLAELLRGLDRPAQLAVAMPAALPEYALPRVLPARLHATPRDGAPRLQVAAGAASAGAAAASAAADDAALANATELTIVASAGSTCQDVAAAIARRPRASSIAVIAAP